MSRDWYKDHPHSGPDSDSEYLSWVQDNGLHVDASGNVDYGPPGCPGGCHEHYSHYGELPCNCPCHQPVSGGAS